MGLDTLDAVDDADGAVEDGEAPVDLEAEVLMARGVDKVDSLGAGSGGEGGVLGPLEGDGGGLDSNSLLALELEEVCYGAPLVDS